MDAERPWRKLYDDEARAFDEAPVADSSFEDLTKQAAAEEADAPFLTTALPNGWSANLSFAEFDEATRRVAHHLRKTLALDDGTVVAVQGPNAISTVVAMVGTLRAGLVLTNLNPLYTPSETQRQLASSGAKVWFVSDLFSRQVKSSLGGTGVEHVISLSLADHFPALQGRVLRFLLGTLKRLAGALPTDISQTQEDYRSCIATAPADDAALARYHSAHAEDDVALLQYSGGTTGTPKAAQLTLNGLMVNLAQGSYHAPEDAAMTGERILLVLPVYHMFGLYMTALSLKTRHHLILAPSPRPLDNLKKTFARFRPTILPGVNTLFVHLMDATWFGPHAKDIALTITGATPLDQDAAGRWLKMTGGRLSESYGLTEATTILTQNPSDERFKPGTVGFPIPGTQLRLRKEDGSWAGVGEAGEILAKGPQLMKGYAGDHTPEIFDADGWLMTGDIGQMDEDGYLTLLDRKKDMLIVGGFNVFPTEIEAVLNTHPGISESAVIGVPDESAGERAYAYVVVRDPALEMSDLFDRCRESLTAYKCPIGIEEVDALPKSAVGKVLRRELRDRHLARDT